MYNNPFIGVGFHAVGGIAHGSFYVPLKKVRAWAWESAWLVQGFAAWLLMPWLICWLTGAHPLAALAQSSWQTIGCTFLYGSMWGAGSLTFGVSMSSGFAFGIQAGQPIAEAAFKNGAPAIFKNGPVFVVVMIWRSSSCLARSVGFWRGNGVVSAGAPPGLSPPPCWSWSPPPLSSPPATAWHRRSVRNLAHLSGKETTLVLPRSGPVHNLPICYCQKAGPIDTGRSERMR